MLSLDLDSPMQDVDISDNALEEPFLVCDTSISEQIKLPFFLPIFILVIFSILSLLFPSLEHTQSVESKLVSNSGSAQTTYFTIKNSVTDLAPIYQYFTLSFKFSKEVPGNINGDFDIACRYQNQLIHSFKQNVTSQPASNQIMLFADEIINFDTVLTKFNFYSDITDQNQLAVLTMTTMDSLCSLAVHFIRIIFSLILATVIFINISCFQSANKESEQTKQQTSTIEQKLTYFLAFTTFLYIDPFYIINLFIPSSLNQVALIVLRDLFYSYVTFYVLAIFSYFLISPTENRALGLAFPYLYMTISIIVFLSQDAENYIQKKTHAAPSFSKLILFDQPTIMHFIYFVLSVLVIVVRVITAKLHLKPEHKQRFFFYTWTTFSVLFLFGTFLALNLFTNLVEKTVIEKVFPLALFVYYALIMEYGHENTETTENGGYSDVHNVQKAEKNEEDLALLVDEDSDMIEKKDAKRKMLDDARKGDE